eukprot:1524942-Amphidinium_carterae.1
MAAGAPPAYAELGLHMTPLSHDEFIYRRDHTVELAMGQSSENVTILGCEFQRQLMARSGLAAPLALIGTIRYNADGHLGWPHTDSPFAYVGRHDVLLSRNNSSGVSIAVPHAAFGT